MIGWNRIEGIKGRKNRMRQKVFKSKEGLKGRKSRMRQKSIEN
jgi:hypothetical protein